jgi:Acetyltransferase (GNAT) domain
MGERSRGGFDAALMEEFRELARTEYAGVADEAYMRWKYLGNPHGAATAQVLREDGQLIGRLAYVPRRLRLGERELEAAFVTDLLVHPDHRTLPTLMELTRGLDAIDVELLVLVADEDTEAILRTVLRSKPLTQLVDAGAPVRLAPLARQKAGPAGWLALPLDAVAPVGVAGLRLLSRGRGVILRDEPPGEDDFASLSATVGTGGSALVGVRDRAWHLWRFHESPRAGYSVRYAWKDGRFAGYVALAQTTVLDVSTVVVLDAVLPGLSARERRVVMLDCWRIARRQGAAILLALASPGDDATGPLRSFPFRPVPERLGARRPKVFHRRTKTTPDWVPAEPAAALTMADFDIF